MKQTESLWTMIQRIRGVEDIRDVCHMTLYILLIKQTDMIWKELTTAFSDADVRTRREIFNTMMGFEYKETCSLSHFAGHRERIIEMYNIQDILVGYEKKHSISFGILEGAFFDLIKKLPKEMILEIISFIEIMNVQSHEVLYGIAENLVLQMTEKAGRSMGETSTNITLAKLEARLLDCGSSMTLYDGFCGTGISVNKVAAKDTKITINDINLLSVSIATILCILGEKNLKGAYCSDTLLNPKDGVEFDRIVSEPPFSVKYSKDYIERIYYRGGIPDKSIDGDSLAVFHTINHLKPDGKATILLPTGFLFRGGKTKNTRKLLLEMNVIDAIIELPEGCLPSTYVPSVLLILNKNRDADNILMISAKGLFRREKRGMSLISDEGIHKIDDMYRRRAVIDGLSSAPTIEEISKADYELSVAKYVIPAISTPERGSIKQLAVDYNDRQKQLQALEKELTTLRKRFIK